MGTHLTAPPLHPANGANQSWPSYPPNPPQLTRLRRLPVAYTTHHHRPNHSPNPWLVLARAATLKQSRSQPCCNTPDSRSYAPPWGLSKPAQLSTTQVRIAPEPCPGLGCLGCFVQSWPGLDRLPPYPPAIHACGARPQGGEGRRALTYKPQRFREQKASRTWVSRGWPQLPGLVCLFVLKA
jgi:hypothetical protein